MTSTTVPPSRIYHWLDYVEDVEMYAPRTSEDGYPSYCPISIGDIVQPSPDGYKSSSPKKYRIVHKLGFGSYSTVWLARDIDRNKLAALKVIIAVDTKGHSNDAQKLDQEIKIHAKLSRSLSETSSNTHTFGRGLILPLLDHFLVESSHGLHRCLVTEPCGPSISSVRYEFQKIPPRFSRRALAVQLAQAITYIHSQGVVHGDLHTGNLLLEIPGMSDWSDEEVTQYLGAPKLQAVQRLDGLPLTPHAPNHLVLPCPITKLMAKAQSSLRLADFGEAFTISSPPEELNTPPALSAPEILWPEKKQQQFSSAVDVWAMACTMFEIFGDHALFSLVFGDAEEVCQEVERVMCNDNGKLRGKLQELVRGTPDTDPTSILDKDELATMENIWMKCLQISPSDRITAGTVLVMLPEAWKRNAVMRKN